MAPSDQPYREIEALRERLSRLSEASRRINESLEFDTVLQGVLDSARSLTSARYGVMTLLGEGGLVQEFLSSGLKTEESERLWLMPDGLRIFQVLTGISEPMRVPDLAQYIHSMGFMDFTIPMPVSVFRFMAAPMFHRGVRVGHVFVGDREDGEEFTREDEETLVMFASQAALVIANARTHREERQARADLETLVNTSPVGVVVFDTQTGEMTSFNREAMRIMDGLRDEEQRAEDLLGVVTCVRSDGREVSLREFPLAELLGSGETVRAEEIVLRVPDGRSVSVLLNATPIHAEDGQVASFVVTLQDLTPLEEQELLRAEFLAMVSHELRSPLMSIKGSADTLAAQSARLDPAEMAQFFRIIQDQAEHMRGLIGDLLDVARIQTGALPVDPEPADLRALVEEAGALFRSADARNPLDVDLAADLPVVVADRRRIVQVLGNLLSNAAASYSSEGSPITVTAVRDGVHVSVSVADRGRGIPEELLPELFRKFSRASGEATPSSVDGSGLGLAICRGIVEAHGGPHMGREQRSWPRGALHLHAASGRAVRDYCSHSPPPPARRRTPRVRILAVDEQPPGPAVRPRRPHPRGLRPRRHRRPRRRAPDSWRRRNPTSSSSTSCCRGADGIDLMNDIRKDGRTCRSSSFRFTARTGPSPVPSTWGRPTTSSNPSRRRSLQPGSGRRSGSGWTPSRGSPRDPTTPGGLAIDYALRRVTVNGEPVELTATEYAVLYQLTVHAPRTLTHAVLLQRVWGAGAGRRGMAGAERGQAAPPQAGRRRREPHLHITPSPGWGTG